jgi:hypothetical protein
LVLACTLVYIVCSIDDKYIFKIINNNNNENNYDLDEARLEDPEAEGHDGVLGPGASTNTQPRRSIRM